MQHDKSIDNKIFSLKFPSDMMRKKQEGKYTYMMHYPMNFLCAYCVTKNFNNEIMKIWNKWKEADMHEFSLYILCNLRKQK